MDRLEWHDLLAKRNDVCTADQSSLETVMGEDVGCVLSSIFLCRFSITPAWKSVATMVGRSSSLDAVWNRSHMPRQTRLSRPVPAPISSTRPAPPGPWWIPNEAGSSAIMRPRMMDEPQDCSPTEVGSREEGRASCSVMDRGGEIVEERGETVHVGNNRGRRIAPDAIHHRLVSSSSQEGRDMGTNQT